MSGAPTKISNGTHRQFFFFLESSKAGIGIWWNHGHRLNVGEPLAAGLRRTNNAAEIHAACEAVRIAAEQGGGVAKLCVNTDSQFLINCVTKWMAGWKRNGWRTAKGDPVINRGELEALEARMAAPGAPAVRWNHVRGHSGVDGNEEADRLAKQGAEAS